MSQYLKFRYDMRKFCISLLFLIILLPSKAQYVGAFGVNVNSTGKIYPVNSIHSEDLVYELSLRVFENPTHCYDIMAGKGSDFYNFTIMKEVHNILFYPIDWSMGLGLHGGLWSKNHWDDGQEHSNNMFFGLDGMVGLQCTLAPIAFSVGVKPYYNFYGGEEFYWMKQVSVRFVFY